MDQKIKALLQDLAQLKRWLVDQMELDHELLMEGQIDNGFQEFGDHHTLVPYYKFLNDRNDLMATLRITTVNQLDSNGVQSYVVDQSDQTGSRPFTHMMLVNRINEVMNPV